MILDNFYEKLYKMLEANNPTQDSGNQKTDNTQDTGSQGNDGQNNGNNQNNGDSQNDNKNDQNQTENGSQQETFTLPSNIKIEDLKPFVNQVLGKSPTEGTQPTQQENQNSNGEQPNNVQSTPQGNQSGQTPTQQLQTEINKVQQNRTAQQSQVQNNVNTNNNVNNVNTQNGTNNSNQAKNVPQNNKNWARKLGSGLKDVGGLAVDAAKAAGQVALEAPGFVKGVANTVNTLTDNWNNGDELR